MGWVRRSALDLIELMFYGRVFGEHPIDRHLLPRDRREERSQPRAGMPFDWSLNPYVGCAHACSFCFARAYHARFRERDVGAGFDRNIELRTNLLERFWSGGRRRPAGPLAIGAATARYEPTEGKYRLTRG